MLEPDPLKDQSQKILSILILGNVLSMMYVEQEDLASHGIRYQIFLPYFTVRKTSVQVAEIRGRQ